MTFSDPQVIRQNKSHILYDASIIAKPDENLFDPLWLEKNAGTKPVHQGGRGAAWFVDYQQHRWVMRQYKRGGMVARWNKQHYLSWSLENTRAWKEWHLLNKLQSLNLPVPKPVAACIRWPYSQFAGLYKAAIIIEQIPDAKTLAEKLQSYPLPKDSWQKIGQCIRSFHNHGVFHADLNANNILFDDEDKLYLIDFDKGDIRQPGEWQNDNIKRLHRSLLKLKSQQQNFNFSEQDWSELVLAYETH